MKPDLKLDALNPSEEITLRRIHYGIAKTGELMLRDIDRLIEVGLVVRQGAITLLTDAGRNRVRGLPSYDQQLAKLVELLTKPGR